MFTAAKSFSHFFWKILYYRWPHKLLVVFLSLLSTVFGLLGPLLQKDFVDRITGENLILSRVLPHLTNWDNWTSLHFLIASFVAVALYLLCSAGATLISQNEALYLQRKLAQEMYEKNLRLRNDQLKNHTVGEVVSYYATDVPGSTILIEQSLPQGAGIFFPLGLTPILLVTLFGVPATILLVSFVAVLGFSLYLGLRQSRFFFFFKKLAADRIGVVNEWIQNIRALRILGWVEQFEAKIFKIRELETRNRILMLVNGQIMNSVSSSVTFFINIAALYALVEWSDQPITSGSLLALLWIVAIFLTRPFRQLPWFFTFVFDAITSQRRLFEFLSISERRSQDPLPSALAPPIDATAPGLKIRKLNLKSESLPLLKDINLDLAPGEFVALVGEVGSGKTLLLNSLMRETDATFESYSINGVSMLHKSLIEIKSYFRFMPQEGFIMSSSLRDNVAFEYEASSLRDNLLKANLKTAQFDLEKERIPEGLDTLIGERGVNLSGGQKQRVSLARLLIGESALVLLDDALSALDVNTAERLFTELLQGELKSTTRLMATHRLNILGKVDRVLFMQSGEIIDSGTYQELLLRNADFRKFTESVAL